MSCTSCPDAGPVRQPTPSGTVVDVRPDIRNAAFDALLDEVRRRDRSLLDTIGATPVLRPHEAAEASVVLQRIVERLPDDLRPENRPGAGSTAYAVDMDGTICAVESLVDDDGTAWMAVTVERLVPFDGTLLESEVDELVNELNINSPGCTWLAAGSSLEARVAGVFRLDRFGERLAALYADLFVGLTAAVHRVIGSEHPSLSYTIAETLAADDAASRFGATDVLDGVVSYLGRLPGPLQRLVHLESDADSVRLALPFYGSAPLVVSVQTMAPGTFEGNWAASGIHILGSLQVPFEETDARAWCRRLNQAAHTDARPPMAWTVGNWRWVTRVGGGSSIVYHGFVPNRHRPWVALGDVVHGAVCAIWSGADQYRLWRTFAETLADGGVDAPAA